MQDLFSVFCDSVLQLADYSHFKSFQLKQAEFSNVFENIYFNRFIVNKGLQVTMLMIIIELYVHLVIQKWSSVKHMLNFPKRKVTQSHHITRVDPFTLINTGFFISSTILKKYFYLHCYHSSTSPCTKNKKDRTTANT